MTGPEVQAAAARRRRAEFAEIMVTGQTLRAAGQQMGLSQSRAGQFWKILRNEFAEIVAEGDSPLYAAIVLGISASVRQRHFNSSDPEKVRRFKGDLPEERYLGRDPCPRCGTRGDMKCGHTRVRT